MPTITCPDKDTFISFLLGKLSGSERESLEQHFATCDKCAANADTLAIDDELTAIIKSDLASQIGSKAFASDEEPAITKLIQRIRMAREQLETVRIEETLAAPPRAPSASVPPPYAGLSENDISFLAPAQSPDEIGRLGDYRVLQVLGMGGMGMVFRAEDPRLKRQVALKTMKPTIAANRDAKGRFLREAQATAALEHDHVVPIYAVDEDRGIPFIAMQYLKGESLRDRLERETKLPPQMVIRLGKEIASGLAAAHDRGLIHRDIKPDNIWLDEKSDRAKILDFGLVSATTEDDGLTQSGTVLGTPRYMAPEQALAHPVDHRSDLFSLGSVLYHAATGNAPFIGNNFTATLIAVAHQPPIPLQTAAPELHPEVASAIMTLLEKDPNKRPQTASEVAKRFADLEQLIKRIQIQPTPDDQLSDTVSYTHPAPSPVLPPNKPPRQRFLLAGAGGFAAILLGILTITIRDKEGKETVIRVPSGTEVEVDAQPGSKVTIREEGAGDIETASKPKAQPAPPMSPSAPNASDESKIDYAAERRAANAIAERMSAGWVDVVDTDKQPQRITASNRTLPGKDFCILSIQSVPEINDDLLALLTNCRKINYLNFAGNSAITTRGLQFLSQASELRELKLAYCTNIDGEIWDLIEFWPNLQVVDFGSTAVKADISAPVPMLPDLRFLGLRGVDVSSSVLAMFATAFPNLEELDIAHGAIVSSANLEQLSKFNNLNTLWCSSYHLTDANVAAFVFTPKLRVVRLLSPVADPPNSIQKLVMLKDKLAELQILVWAGWDQGPSSEDYTALAQLTRLEILSLHGHAGSPTNDELLGLAGIPALTSLQVGFDEAPRNYDMAGIAACKRLRPDLEIVVDGLSYQGEPIPSLVQKNQTQPANILPLDFDLERKIAQRLLRLDKGRFILGNKDRQPVADWNLANLPSEPYCILDANFDGTDLLNEEIVALKGCQALQSLRISGNPQLTAAGLNRIGPLPSLNRLWADGTPIGNDLFDWLSGSPNIKELYLANSAITGEGLERLPDLPNLENLSLNCAIAQPGLEALVNRCANLRHLMCYSSSGDNLAALGKLRYLNSLHTDGAILSETGIQTLRQVPALENLFIDSPTPDGIERLADLHRKLITLTLRQQQPASPLTTESDAWETIVQMSGLKSLSIGGNLAVDAKLLERFASMIHLKELSIEHLTDDRLAKAHRRFSDKDALAFHNKRPDLALTINGNSYPALDDWPGKFEGSRSIAAWELPADAPKPAIVPFTPEEAAQNQAAWAEYLKVPVESQNSIGMKFRLIPPGEFTSGDGSSPYRPTKVALERLTNAYELGMTEVTVAQFQAFVKATGYITETERLANADSPQLEGGWGIPRGATWRTPGYVVQPTMPVTLVSMSDANAFCEWLSKTEGKEYRLPTAVEWNFAVFGSGQFRFGWWSEAEVLQKEWFANNLPSGVQGPQPVASKASNPFGLYDAIGNVCELSINGYYSCGRQGYGWTHHWNSKVPTDWIRINFWGVSADTGFRIVRSLASSAQVDGAVVLIPRQSPLSPVATVARPTAIPGIRSWSVERISHSIFADNLRWSPRGDLIATSSNDYSVRLWDRAGKLKTLLIGHRGPVRSLSFSSDGKLLASISGGTDGGPATSELRVWDVDSGRCIRETFDEYHEPRLRFSPSGDRLAVQGIIRGSHMMEILDFDTLTPSPLPFLATSGAFAWSKDGETILGFDADKLVEVQVSDRQILRRFDLDLSEDEIRGTKEIAVSPDGSTLAIVTPSTLRLLDLQKAATASKSSLDYQSLREVQWAPTGQQLLIVGNNEKADHIQVFDVPTGAISMRLNGYSDESSAWSPDATEIALFNRNLQAVTFIRSSTGEMVRTGAALLGWLSRPQSKLFSANDKMVAGGREFSATSGNLIRTQKVVPGPLMLVSPTDQWRAYRRQEAELDIIPRDLDRDTITLAVPMIHGNWRTNPTGELIAQANSQDIEIWSTATGQRQESLKHPANIWSFEWSPDGNQIASIATDERVRIWDSKSRQLVSEFSDLPSKLAPFYHVFGGAPVLQWSFDNRHLWIPQTQGWARLDMHTGSVDRRGTETLNHCSSLVLAPNEQRLLFREGECWTTLVSADGSQTRLGVNVGISAQWHDDSRRFLGSDYNGLIAYDAVSKRRLGTLWADLPDGHWMCVGPTGHCRGSKGVAEHVVYVAQLDDGSNITLSPQEFAKRFGWKNDPEKATLMDFNE